MKKVKSLVALSLALCMVLCFAGCSSNNDEGNLKDNLVTDLIIGWSLSVNTPLQKIKIFKAKGKTTSTNIQAVTPPRMMVLTARSLFSAVQL